MSCCTRTYISGAIVILASIWTIWWLSTVWKDSMKHINKSKAVYSFNLNNCKHWKAITRTNQSALTNQGHQIKTFRNPNCQPARKELPWTRNLPIWTVKAEKLMKGSQRKATMFCGFSAFSVQLAAKASCRPLMYAFGLACESEVARAPQLIASHSAT